MVIRAVFIVLLWYPGFAVAQDVNLDQPDRKELPAILGDDVNLTQTMPAFPPGEVTKCQESYIRAAKESLRQSVTGNLAPVQRSLRPEYVAAADSARWNIW